MRKYIRKIGIVVAFPVLLFMALCILIYLPPVQSFLVNTATRYASRATGMQISIGRISLSFPLDLVVHRALVINRNDTILDSDRLKVEIQLLPLFKQQIEVDGVRLEKTSVNTAGLLEGMVLKGYMGSLFISSHGVNPNPETAIVNELSLKDTHLSLCLTDTTVQDTASSSPIYWKIHLQKIDLERVSFNMHMPLDTLDMQVSAGVLSLRDGLVDLHRSAYSARAFMIKGGKFSLDSNPFPPQDGLDPSHIDVTEMNIGMDSIYYAGNDIRALIHKFNLKERSGLKITSGKGRMVSDAYTLNIPSLHLQTDDSSIELNASMDWDAMDADKEGAIHVRFMADIGKNDLLKLVTGLPEEFVRQYPSAPFQIRAGIDGNLNDLHLTAFSASIPGSIRAEATGSVVYPLDSMCRNGSLHLAMRAEDLDFLKTFMEGMVIPPGTAVDGTVSMNGSRLGTELTMKDGGKGSVVLSAGFDLTETAYEAKIDIDSLNLHAFMPKDSLYDLSARIEASGKGIDFFSPRTRLEATGELSSLHYGHLLFSGLKMETRLEQSQGTVNLTVTDHDIDASVHLEAFLDPHRIKAGLNAQITHLDLKALEATDKKINPTLNIEAHAQTDLQATHSLQVSLTDICFVTDEKTVRTKDLHAGAQISPDSIRSFVNAGDLTFLFRSSNDIDRLTSDATSLVDEFGKQWSAKALDLNRLKQLLPSAQLHVFSGSDNPIANLLSANNLRYDRLLARLSTSPEKGIDTDINLYGLHTDSLRLDTIYFGTCQDTARFYFRSEVKALANRNQEAFNIGLDGCVGSTEARLSIEYLNGEQEKGVDLGLKACLHPHGISLHVFPEQPILVYRPFQANPGNYIYLNDDGRIHANLRLSDANHSGLSIYSESDSLALQDLTFSLNRINIAEFRRIVPYMPDIAGLIDAEAHYIRTDLQMQVAADMQVDSLAYNRYPMGNWGITAVYLPQEDGSHGINGFVSHNNAEIISLSGTYKAGDPEGLPDKLDAGMQLNHFPLSITNAFVPPGLASLSGDLDGEMHIGGAASRPVLNGTLHLDSVQVNVPQASLTLRIDDNPIKIDHNRIEFEQFNIFTGGDTPFSINGCVDMGDLTTMNIDLNTEAHNFELINAKKQGKESMVYGKLYVDFSSIIKGTPDALTMRGNMNILGNSDFTYILQDSPLTVEDRLGEMVTFVDFRDTTSVNLSDIQPVSLGGMDILMTLHIDEAVQARVDLNESGSNYMLLEGGGDLSFQYQSDGNMVLSGRYSLISGEMKYEMPVIPLKTFHIQNGSYIEWTGDMMNPNLNIQASERVRASVSSEDSGSRIVNFDVGVSLTNRLENLGFTFTLEAPDDGTMQNELASKSAEEKNKLAVTMLVTGMYMADNNSAKGFDTGNMLNSFLQSEINKVAGSALKSIDINFGMETTEAENGVSRTDYNFQFAKRFWNNRFQVVIGGKISTGNDIEQEDESFIDNISLEYRLDNSGTRYIKIFHDKNYESILDGEVIETGAGLVLRKKVSKLGELFIFRTRKKEKASDTNTDQL